MIEYLGDILHISSYKEGSIGAVVDRAVSFTSACSDHLFRAAEGYLDDDPYGALGDEKEQRAYDPRPVLHQH
ncbi:hypothetical protein [Nonomuraea sp. NPDC049141]|uniref:hypothetical protein n=1 Tax=Nonomuraea sp. NPDC049141 TaxID=3155500 RepID=UPI0033FFC2B7